MDSNNHENRTLADKPVLTKDNYRTFADEYLTYFNDNIPFRNELIRFNAYIDYYIFHKPSNENVVIGSDGWLFYADRSDGNPIACYQGEDLLSEEELSLIAQNCTRVKEYLAKQGIQFIVFIAPNKERIYAEYMPDRYGEPAKMYATLQIVEYLRQNTDVTVVYPYEELMEAKNRLNVPIYYETDTHWNAIGGYIGAAALMKELGITMPDISELEVTGSETVGGDLASMLNMNDRLKQHTYVISGYDTHHAVNVKSDHNDVYSDLAFDADPRKIYLCRDSFAMSMADYIGSQFSKSYFKHTTKFSNTDLSAQKPDIFVLETVERYAVVQLEKNLNQIGNE